MEKIKFNYFFHNEGRVRYESLDDIVAMVRNEKYVTIVKKMREKVTAAVAMSMNDRINSDLNIPSVCLAEGECGYSGLLTLSLPMNDDMERLVEVRRMLVQLPQIVCLFTGVSGRSLKVVMRYCVMGGGELPDDTNTISRFHHAAHSSATAFLLQVTGVKADGRYADWHSAMLISSDADIYYNKEAVAVPLAIPAGDTQCVSLSESDEYDVKRLPEYNTLQMEMLKFNMVCRRINLDKLSDVDERVLLLASECRKAGISEEVAVKCTLHLSDEWRSHELLVRTSFENLYKEKSKGDRQILPKSLMNQYLLRHFLQKRYLFRRNTVTGSCEYMERDRYVTQWRALDEIARNTICLSAQMAGIEAWDNDILRYVNSAVIDDYDPIAQWIYDLPHWDGRDRVAELAAMVKTDYQAWDHDLRIWLRSMVSQWMQRGGLYGSCIVLMLAGGQGTGKSTFFKRLLPSELLTYYNDRIDFANKREAERALMRFVLICMDEFDQITKSQTAYLKHIIQKSDIKWRKMYEDEITQRHRYAAFCATTNSMMPLTDPSGSRRYLCVNVIGRIDTVTEIDHKQLYAQIVHEIRSGAPCYFSAEEENRIQESNKDFYQEMPLETLFNNCFRKPVANEKGVSLTALEILQHIKSKAKGVRCDASGVRSIGKMLTHSDIKRTRVARGWVYNVVEQ